MITIQNNEWKNEKKMSDKNYENKAIESNVQVKFNTNINIKQREILQTLSNCFSILGN